MSNTHYYYALNRNAAERVVSRTWNQFIEKSGRKWPEIGRLLAFGLDKPRLPEEPTLEEIALILKQTIRETLSRMIPYVY